MILIILLTTFLILGACTRSAVAPAPTPSPAPAPLPAQAPAPTPDPVDPLAPTVTTVGELRPLIDQGLMEPYLQLNPFGGKDFATKPDGTPYVFALSWPHDVQWIEATEEWMHNFGGITESLIHRAGGDTIDIHALDLPPADPALDILLRRPPETTWIYRGTDWYYQARGAAYSRCRWDDASSGD